MIVEVGARPRARRRARRRRLGLLRRARASSTPIPTSTARCGGTPTLDPLPSYGNTSMVFGNCGNSIAPLAGPQRDEIVDLLCFLEDLPLEAFQRRGAVDLGDVAASTPTPSTGQPTTVHVGGYLGHLALRTYVMGADAWSARPPPTRSRAWRTCSTTAWPAGALGLSRQPLRQGPHPAAGPGLLRRRRRVPRAVRRSSPGTARRRCR